MKSTITRTMLAMVFLGLAACGGEASPEAASSNPEGLSDEQMENGIGPVTSVDLGPIQEALAAQGEEIFTTKCALCHKANDRYVGPPLATVLDRRSPEYIMNMMLNPDEMTKVHPEARSMLAEFMTQMPNQNLTEDDSRAILEYLRVLQEENDEDDTSETD